MTVTRLPYRGRFAPTPSGPLHAGSIVAALASWLDARAHGGTWLVRIEDTDTPRCAAGADEFILHQLERLGLRSDEAVQWQSQRVAHYEAALAHLRESGWAYGCACSRADIERALEAAGLARARHAAAVYPGTCRTGTGGRPPRAWRVRVGGAGGLASPAPLQWTDRRLGPQSQSLADEVGDFVVLRADGLWAYQLAVVVDDALQGITDVVRGADLADNTPRQQWLQQRLGFATPRYLHTPLVMAPDGQKLSKQTGAQAIDTAEPLQVLQEAARVLELGLAPVDQYENTFTSGSGLQTTPPQDLDRWLKRATEAWGRRWLDP